MTAAIPTSTLEKFTTFGDLLRYLRRRAGITQVDLSLAVGYSNAQISRLEQNLRPPDLTMIEARFVPALGLEQEPKAVARLLELATNVRREDAPAAGLCPYKGLNYFDEADADLFVGREVLTAKLVARVLVLAQKAQAGDFRFLAVVGASGSGKSSLVRAGLIPALRWEPASASWPIHILTPGVHPLERLAASLMDEDESLAAAASLTDDLLSDPRSLHLFMSRKLKAIGATEALLLVDQFEELFTLCRSETERRGFIANLLVACSDLASPTVVVITLRADFYPHCAAYPELRDALARTQEYIGALSDEELRRAIEEPAQRGRWEFEPGLVDQLMHDVGHEPGALPLLSHALLETWERRRGHTMTLSGYASSGGVRGAVAETAAAVFTDQFTPEQQAIARRVFLSLTELGDETGTGDTRRRATFDELIRKPQDADATRSVLTALAASRLITITGDAVEVAHEALIREWPTLRGWLEDDRENLRLHRHLAQAAREWARMGREEDALYRGARLTQLREWALANADEMGPLEREFYEASVQTADREVAEREARRQREIEAAQKLAEAERQHAEEQERASNRLRLRSQILSILGAVTLLLAVLAGIFGWQSRQNAATAGQNLVLAQANLARSKNLGLALAAEVLLAHDGDAQIATLLSIRALKLTYSPEADASLSGALDRFTLRHTYFGHSGWVYSVAISPDEKYVLTGSDDGNARLWDLSAATEVRRFGEQNAGVAAVAFSPDGKYVATGNNLGTVRLWDAGTGAQTRVLRGHTDGVTSVAFSPDGRYILSSSGDRTARLWDTGSGRLIRTFTGHTALVTQAIFSPDGQHVLTGSMDGTARLWDSSTGQTVRTFLDPDPGHPDGDVTGVAFSPDGQTIIIGRRNQTTGLWNSSSGRQSCALVGGTYAVNAVAFSPDGKYVATAGKLGTTIIWSADSCQSVRIYKDYGSLAALNDDVKAVAFSPDGRYVMTGGFDQVARLWSAPGIAPLRTFAPAIQSAGIPAAAASVNSVAISPDGKYILAGSQDHVARLWDRETGMQLRAFAGHTGAVNGVAFSPDGKLALTGSADHTIRLWDVATGRPLRSIDTGISNVTGVAFSPDGKYVFGIGTGATALDGTPCAISTRLWDVSTGQLVHAYDFGFYSTLDATRWLGFAVSADGRRVLVRNLAVGALLLDAFSGEGICDFSETRGDIYSAALSKDGKYALTGGADKTARLWDLATCKEIRSFTDNTSVILSVAFSPDGKYVLTGQEDRTARLWDLASGALVRQFSGHTGAINSAIFSSNGRFVVTGSQDGTVRLWDTDYRDTIRFACSVVARDLSAAERHQYGITEDDPTCLNP